MKLFWVLGLSCCLFILPASAQEPKLPAGLSDNNEPLLPAGLGINVQEEQSVNEPVLPFGLLDSNEQAESSNDPKRIDKHIPRLIQKELPFHLSGFWEARGGLRVVDDPNEKQHIIAETRLQLRLHKIIQNSTLNLITDLIYDQIEENLPVHLNSGRGFIDLREANFSFSPMHFTDIKLGRQILTWGTGDLIFINDLFPKDFNAFFIGRDEAYIKAPSDAIKFSLFSQWAHLDIVYSPQFDSDRFIDGSRVSFFSPMSGVGVGRNAVLQSSKPDNGELALRLHRKLGSYETALYFYAGYWKSPGGINPSNGLALFPRLHVTGASIRGPVGRGIGNVEIGHYDSRDDHKGSNPLINNSEFRTLLGYEQEIAKNLSLGVQYYLEHLLDYSNYLYTLPDNFPQRDQNRHLWTTRLTFLTHNQNITWSIFSYFSPSDMDFYLRPKVNYKINDHWITELGGNLFGGRRDSTLFGQFQNNSNIYLSLRYGF